MDEEQLEKEIVLAVREHVGPVASFRSAIAINKLPKTRSGKVARHTIASMITRKPFSVSVLGRTHRLHSSSRFVVESLRSHIAVLKYQNVQHLM